MTKGLFPAGEQAGPDGATDGSTTSGHHKALNPFEEKAESFPTL